jgi:maltooligosyltrehalose trehalohydrolase
MQRMHSMPFGAQMLNSETARFKLWAPSARQVELCLIQRGIERVMPMTAEADGWYNAVAPVTAGIRYRYRINGDIAVPDPASRFQPDDVHGPSELIDPRVYQWRDADWKGRPWEEAVLYELHVGSFTAEGSYAGVQARLEHLCSLGVTAIELMPLADFPGKRNWGYDGVLPYAPESRYGRPDDLKRLIDTAHQLRLMVFLDVVYNHFGPEGNYLSVYAKPFFTDRHKTPWGAAINFDDTGSRTVRDYFIHNALYWLEEYRFDGLRFDAVHAIMDDSTPDILTELAQAVARGPGAHRQIHLVLENDDNEARYLARDNTDRPLHYTAQWNDDIHHAMHTLATGEAGGYYADYADAPLKHLARCLTEGFAYQGDPSPFRHGAPRGERSTDTPLDAFVSFLQNHDQVGNRAFGERITDLAPTPRVRALSAIFLLAPAPPLLFMGEEWATPAPFPFFCDFGPELARAVTEGRRKEFGRFPQFSDPEAQQRIPDPNDPATFRRAILDWEAIDRPEAAEWLAWHREVLTVRRQQIVPHLAHMKPSSGRYELLPGGLRIHWMLGDGAQLALLANLSDQAIEGIEPPPGRAIYKYPPTGLERTPRGRLDPWSVAFYLEQAF